jgi:predicted metal-binding protein
MRAVTITEEQMESSRRIFEECEDSWRIFKERKNMYDSMQRVMQIYVFLFYGCCPTNNLSICFFLQIDAEGHPIWNPSWFSSCCTGHQPRCRIGSRRLG